MKKEHLLSVDLIRLLSFLAIVMVHVSKVVFEHFTQVDATSWWIAMFLNSVTRFGTPMFVMVSGYLLLGSETVKNPRQFYIKRLSKIMMPLVFWNIFYYFLYCRLNNMSPGWGDFWVRFLSGGTYYHLYFMQLIAGLYVVSPLLVKIMNKINLNVVVPTLILLSFGYLYAYSHEFFPEMNNTFLWFIPYIGYYLAGYWIGNMKTKISWWWFLVAGGLLMVGVIGKGNFMAHRLSISVAVASILLFWLIIKTEIKYKELQIMSELGMGLYLVHPLMIELFMSGPIFSRPVWWMLTTYAGVVILTWLTVWLIKRIPVLERVV